MKTLRKLLCLMLCMVLCLSLAAPAFAAGENNTKGVTFSVSLDKATLEQSDADQTVVMTLSASKEIELDGAWIDVDWDAPLTMTGATTNIVGMSIPKSNGIDLNTGWVTLESDDAENVSGITDIFSITFIVPAGTEAGAYEVGVAAMELTADWGDIVEDGASATATLTITGGEEEPDPDVPDNTDPVQPEISGYSAGLVTTTSSVTIGEKVYVSVSVNHEEETSFNAGELTLTFDAAKLRFIASESTLGGAVVEAGEGTLALADYGANKTCGNGIYTLVFEAVVDGAANVTLTEAAFSNQENAATSDLIVGTISPAAVEITVNKKQFAVELPEGMTGAAVVTDGASYTFSIKDNNYNYSNVSATVDGVNVTVIDNGDGTYTVEAVDGALVITADRSPKSYAVSFAGNAAAEITDGAATATYGTAYSFTMPSTTGWAYSLGGITIGGSSYTGYTVDGSVYTIPGTAITGAIEITVNKTQTVASVTVTGTGAGAAAGYEPSANIGESYTLTINPEAGYTYTVTAAMGGEPIELTRDGNNYTIANVTGNIVFTVEHAAVVDGVSVGEYVSIDGSKVWLVKNTVTLAEGKVPTYNGSPMLWSEAYETYCYLVIADTLSIEDAKAAIGIADGTAEVVADSMDVNMTGNVDANDAQLTYNIYNAYYAEFSNAVTMEKFLLADVNKDGKVDVSDAAAIISHILNA